MAKSQTNTGKAFEYALIHASNSILTSKGITVKLTIDNTFLKAQTSFNTFSQQDQNRYLLAANKAINHIISIEPRLHNTLSTSDTLTLMLQPDSAGQIGDVRDLLFIRSSQQWEIGISAKNNHRALKHSRLSNTLDFGNSWVGINCSSQYFKDIEPIFRNLDQLKSKGALWSSITGKSSTIYQPLLKAFKDELLRINSSQPNIPSKLTKYLIGNHDFYKVIKKSRTVEVLGFNINGTLGKRIGSQIPSQPITRLSLPTQIVQFQLKANSNDTLSMICDKGWQFTFRIHNAESKVVPSLKFDINLVSNPSALYSHIMAY